MISNIKCYLSCYLPSIWWKEVFYFPSEIHFFFMRMVTMVLEFDKKKNDKYMRKVTKCHLRLLSIIPQYQKSSQAFSLPYT